MNPAGRRTARTDSPIDTDALEMTDRTGEVDRTSHATVATAGAAGVLPPVTPMLTPGTVATAAAAGVPAVTARTFAHVTTFAGAADHGAHRALSPLSYYEHASIEFGHPRHATAAAAAPADDSHRAPSPLSSVFYTSSEPTSSGFMPPPAESHVYQGTVVRHPAAGGGIPPWKQMFFDFACAINKTDGNVSAIAPTDIDNILRMLPPPEAGDSTANNIRECLTQAKELQDTIITTTTAVNNNDYTTVDTCDMLRDVFIFTFLSCTTPDNLPGFRLTSTDLLAAREQITALEAAGAASARPASEPAAAFADE
jgi:hypothetical protein